MKARHMEAKLMDDPTIYREIVELQQEGKTAVLATVVESSGSTPRKAGAKMLVMEDGSTRGTIGGGRIELDTVLAAREALRTGQPRTVSYTLNEEYGHVCGGRLLVFIEPVSTAPRLLVIGAGHVGKAVAKGAVFAGFRVVVVDERSELLEAPNLPDTVQAFCGDATAAFSHYPVDDSSFVLIATPTFGMDFEAVRAALRTATGYIGLIGSARKREVLLATLAAEGIPAEEIARVIIPVGLAIGAETPEEIAISIVAQMVETRRNHEATCAGRGFDEGEGTTDGTPAAVTAG